eukprot:428633_1
MNLFNIICTSTFAYTALSILPPSPPPFSWETLPLFIHCSNNSGILNETEAKYMSQFPMATINKQADSHDQSNTICNYPCEEDKIIYNLQQIRNYSITTRTIFYLNSVLNFKQYKLSTNFYGQNESLLLHDSNGKLLYYTDCHPKSSQNVTIFDLSQNKTRSLWLNTIQYALTSKPNVVDGIFADKNNYVNISICGNITKQKSNDWMNGHTLLFQQAQKLITSINKERGILITDNSDVSQVNARMFANFSLDENIDPINGGNDLISLINENGNRISQVHEDDCVGYSYLYNRSLTAFLIGAYKYSYYACSNGWLINNGWLNMYKEYIKPLGKPLFNATYKNNIYHRMFTYNVSVWLDNKWQHPCILWGDNSITGTVQDCKMYTNLI